MSETQLNLQCSQCGGKSILSTDGTSAICSYCGATSLVANPAQHHVEVLQAMEDNRQSNDKLAAELALPRLRAELFELDKIIAIEKFVRWGVARGLMLFTGIVLLVIDLRRESVSWLTPLAIVLIIFGAFVLVTGIVTGSKKNSESEMQRHAVATRISEMEQIVNS
jgi:hypothetical protein